MVLEGDVSGVGDGGDSLSLVEFPSGEISVLEPGDLSDDELDQFSQNLTETNFGLKEGVTLGAERNVIRGGMVRLRNRVGAMPFLNRIVSSDSFQGVADQVYPDYSRQEHVDGSINKMKRFMEEGCLWGNKVGDRVVSIQGAPKSEHDFQGRPVFEFTKASTLKEFEKRGYNKALKEHIVERVGQEHPDAVWFSMSKNEEHLARLQGRGWEVYDLDDPAAPAQFMRESNGNYWTTLHEEKYKVLYWDPTKE